MHLLRLPMVCILRICADVYDDDGKNGPQRYGNFFAFTDATRATVRLDLLRETTNENENIKESRVKITTPEPGHTKELPNNRSNIDENALYEHAAVKQNNQSERAFIYINQKYRKPSLHQYFRLAQNGPEFSRSFHLPPPLPQAFIRRRNEPCKSETEQVNSYYNGYNMPFRAPDIPTYFLPPPLVYNCNYKDFQNILREIPHDSNKKLHNYNIIQNNMRPDFIELLKPPLLRPSDRVNVKVKYDGISGPRFSPHNYKNIPYHPPIRNEHNSKANILVDERKSDTRKKYGFSSYVLHPAFQSTGIIQKVEEPGFEGELILDEKPSRFHEKPQYEDKLLDQYLRDALGEQVTSKEKEIVKNDCSYPDCVLQSTKHSSSITHQKDTNTNECKCGQRLKLKAKDFFLSKNKPDRREKHLNKTNNTLIRPPSDLAYFKEMMSQTSNTKTQDDGLAFNTIIRVNSTLYH
ncbi:unnamed protein product [Arctia plantaginis]|uniref:Uncharacterized protein n=1 Tax=Arctia plantaginis TaxID=874455 RepID=A0A8S1AH54_ARCPL|nr:unnamed protein product [Arctia plantaginis]